MSEPLTPTPEIDAWCELAMHSDVSAVLNLAKGFECRLHAKESELEAAQNIERLVREYVSVVECSCTGDLSKECWRCVFEFNLRQNEPPRT